MTFGKLACFTLGVVSIASVVIACSSSSDGGSSCESVTSDLPTCTFAYKCSTTLNGVTIESTTTIVVTNGNPSGTLEVKTTGGQDPDTDCKYTITYTKESPGA